MAIVFQPHKAARALTGSILLLALLLVSQLACWNTSAGKS